MIIHPVSRSQREAARLIGASYLVAMATAVFGFYVRGQMVVPGNATATALNIVNSTTLFRASIASDITTFVIDVLLIASLYVTLAPIKRTVALIATLWRLIETAVLLVVTLNGFAALRLLSDADYLHVMEPGQLHALARLSLAAYASGYNVGFVFLGLGSTAFAYLWLRSGYIPKALALLGIGASLLLAVCNFIFILFPDAARIVGPVYMLPLGLFEVSMGVWLLLKGLRSNESEAKD